MYDGRISKRCRCFLSRADRPGSIPPRLWPRQPPLIGDVTIEAGASVWFNAVLRGDYAPVVVREGANVQDGAVLHAPPGIPVDIGPGRQWRTCV